MKYSYFEKTQHLLEETFKKNFLSRNLALNFINSVTILKLISTVLLIHGEYSYLIWPICPNQPQRIALLYPYAAFASVILLGLTHFCLSDTDITQCIRIELISNLLLGIVMFGVSWLSLRYCVRPSGFVYYLPEIYGPLVALVLLTHTLIWYNRQFYQRVPTSI